MNTLYTMQTGWNFSVTVAITLYYMQLEGSATSKDKFADAESNNVHPYIYYRPSETVKLFTGQLLLQFKDTHIIWTLEVTNIFMHR